jgi:hypothetical protein
MPGRDPCVQYVADPQQDTEKPSFAQAVQTRQWRARRSRCKAAPPIAECGMGGPVRRSERVNTRPAAAEAAGTDARPFSAASCVPQAAQKGPGARRWARRRVRRTGMYAAASARARQRRRWAFFSSLSRSPWGFTAFGMCGGRAGPINDGSAARSRRTPPVVPRPCLAGPATTAKILRAEPTYSPSAPAQRGGRPARVARAGNRVAHGPGEPPCTSALTIRHRQDR